MFNVDFDNSLTYNQFLDNKIIYLDGNLCSNLRPNASLNSYLCHPITKIDDNLNQKNRISNQNFMSNVFFFEVILVKKEMQISLFQLYY
jgi:hypothetical protein